MKPWPTWAVVPVARLLIGLSTACLAFAPEPVKAALATYAFSGVINPFFTGSHNEPLPPGVTGGGAVQGAVLWDPSAPGVTSQFQTPDGRTYQFPTGFALWVSVAGNTWLTNTNPLVQIEGAPNSIQAITTQSILPPSSFPLFSDDLGDKSMNFLVEQDHPPPDLITTPDLPTGAVNFGNGIFGSGDVFSGDPSTLGTWRFGYDLTSFAFQPDTTLICGLNGACELVSTLPVAEPATLSLLATAIAGLGLVRCRRARVAGSGGP